MTTEYIKKISFKPTDAFIEALNCATEDDRRIETYTGTWLRSNTVRKLIKIAYAPNNFYTKIQRRNVSSVNLTQQDYTDMLAISPMEPREADIAYGFRILVSALVQRGYLSDEGERPEVTEIRNKRFPRRSETSEAVA